MLILAGRQQYGFVCVVSGADQPVGEAIIYELAGTATSPDAEDEIVEQYPRQNH